MSDRNVAIILAAGSGERMGGAGPKAFLSVGGLTMLELSMRAAAASPKVASLVVAAPEGFEAAIHDVEDVPVPVVVVTGGGTRQASVVAALAVVEDEVPAVVVHDAARPFASAGAFTRVLEALDDHVEGVVPVLPIPDTIKRVREDRVVATEPREELFLAQTPQAFRTEVLRTAHQRAATQGRSFTDDAALLEWAGYRVRAIAGEPDNLKITTPMDLARAEAVVETGGALR